MAPESMQDRPERAARARDAAGVLPLLGLFLLMPPAITLFAAPVDLAGVPLVVVYLFSVWLGLVLSAALLGRLLRPRAAPPQRRPPPA